MQAEALVLYNPHMRTFTFINNIFKVSRAFNWFMRLKPTKVDLNIRMS